MMTLRDWIKREEGFRSEPYLCPTGHKTIGYGHNLEAHPVYLPNDNISEDFATRLLKDDIAGVDSDLCYYLVEKDYNNVADLDESRWGALVCMAFQIGVHGLLKFKRMLKALEEGRWEDAAKCALDSLWAKQTPARAQRVAKVLKTGVMVTEDDFT